MSIQQIFIVSSAEEDKDDDDERRWQACIDDERESTWMRKLAGKQEISKQTRKYSNLPVVLG